MSRLPPEDRLLAALFTLALLTIALLIYDVRRGEPTEGFPSQDRAAEVCAIRWLRDLAAAHRIPLNGDDGHGRAWDELMAACADDLYMLRYPSPVTMDSVLNQEVAGDE